MPADLTRLIPRYRRAKAKWDEAASRLQEIAEFLLPYQSNVTIFGSEGRKKTNRLYHSAGIVAADKLARTMHGTVTPDAFEWHSPVMREAELNKVKTIRAWLQEVSKRMYAARRQSNFSMAIGRFYSSFCALATGGLYVEEKPTRVPGTFGGLHYSFLPMGTYAIEQNGDERVDVLYRDLRWPLRNVVERFGLSVLPDELQRKFQDGKSLDEDVDFVHAVYPRVDRDPRRNNTKNWEWASCYFIEKGGTGSLNGSILSESGFREQPMMVARWDVSQREIWGTGPGHLAYPDVRSLNRIRQLKLEAGGMAVLPPTIKTQKILLTEVALAPGSVMMRSQDNPAMPALEAFDNKAKFDVAELLEQDMVVSINDMYYLAEILLQDRPNMTATEVLARQEEKQRLLGPTMGRLQSELLTLLFEREFSLMYRGGALPPAPDELLEAVQAGQGDIDVEWEGPLARAQRSYELVAMERQNQATFTVAVVRPEVLDLYDWDEQERRRAEITGYPADLLKDARVVAQERAARAEQQQQMAQAQGLMGMAEAGGKVAPLVQALQPAKEGAAA